MGINDIELPADAVTTLYKNLLVDGTAPAVKAITTALDEAPVIAEPGALRWLGNNQQAVLIVVDYDTAVHVPDSNLTFLTGILTACRLTIADVAIVNVHQQKNYSCKEMLQKLGSKNILLFNVEPVAIGLPIDFPHYQLQAFTGVTYLYSPSLEQLENDKVEKSKLWSCLKKMFNL